MCGQIQEVVKCQMGGCRSDENEDSPNSCKNGQLQIMVGNALAQISLRVYSTSDNRDKVQPLYTRKISPIYIVGLINPVYIL